MIPISTVRLSSAVEESVLRVIRSGTIAQGPMVAEFESRFAEIVGANHAIAVNNGTTALVAAVQALGLAPGDEVITSPFTFIATLNAILEAGATVRFGDIRTEDFALDPESVRAQITDRTKVIMPVHLYGQSAEMSAIAAIADEYGLAIVEDAAQAHGATFEGRAVGTFGIGCFSFYATKNLTTGEGGVITTNDDAIAENLRIMRNQGMRARYEYVMAGHNYRLTDLQAAVVLPQLDAYPDQVVARRANAAGLQERLDGTPGLVLPQQLAGRGHVWHQFTVLLPEGTDRQALVASLAEDGVGSGIYYPKPVYDYDTYRDRVDVIRSATPVAENVAERCLSLPVHQYLSADDLDTIASALKRALGAQ
ncbi:MAG: DegT/DnrJ/EryC1/StrS family aminotransferase [Microbacterium sp.]|nr:MAG: DegT/DnrJ/EryC1/StrS family aminotransferase [Microbacterium sp.]